MAGGTASWHQVGTATSPAGPCPTARPSVELASGLKPRLSRGMPEAVSFASKVRSMSSCACERSVSPKLLRGATCAPHTPQHTSLRQGNRGNCSPGQVLPGAGCEAAQLLPRVPFPGAEGPVSTPRHASPAVGGTRGGPSPSPHLANAGELELQLLDGGVLGIEDILQRQTGCQAAAAPGRGHCGCAVTQHTEQSGGQPPPCLLHTSTARDSRGQVPLQPLSLSATGVKRGGGSGSTCSGSTGAPCQCSTSGMTGRRGWRQLS